MLPGAQQFQELPQGIHHSGPGWMQPVCITASWCSSRVVTCCSTGHQGWLAHNRHLVLRFPSCPHGSSGRGQGNPECYYQGYLCQPIISSSLYLLPVEDRPSPSHCLPQECMAERVEVSTEKGLTCPSLRQSQTPN